MSTNETQPLDLTSEEQYLEAIIRPLVKEQANVKIERKVDERGILLSLNIAKADMGRVIGKQGESARAIRRLIRQFGMTTDQHISLKINEPVTE